LLAVAAVCCFGFEPPVPSLVIVFQWLPGFEDLREDEGDGPGVRGGGGEVGVGGRGII